MVKIIYIIWILSELWKDNGGDWKNDINCSGICQSLTALRRNVDIEFIVVWFYFKFVAYSRKLSGASQLDNYHRRIRASSSYCEKVSFSMSPFPFPLFVSFFPLLGDFQPPPPLIPSSNRENTHCLSRESGVVQKYRELVDSRRVVSRITYRARINPRRLYNLSLFPCVPFPSFAHRHFFFPSPYRHVRPSSWSFSRIDVTHASLMPTASGFSDPRAEQSEHDEGYIPRIRVRWSRRQLMVRWWKNVIVSLRACVRRGIISTINCTFAIKPVDNGGASYPGRVKAGFRLDVSPNLLPLYMKYKIPQKIWSK